MIIVGLRRACDHQSHLRRGLQPAAGRARAWRLHGRRALLHRERSFQSGALARRMSQSGLVGFTALASAFVIYIILNYGVRGSYQMVYRLHSAERAMTAASRLAVRFLRALRDLLRLLGRRLRRAAVAARWISSSRERGIPSWVFAASATAISFTGWMVIGASGDDLPRRVPGVRARAWRDRHSACGRARHLAAVDHQPAVRLRHAGRDVRRLFRRSRRSGQSCF